MVCSPSLVSFLMNYLIWNLQGAGSNDFHRAFRHLLNRNRVDIVTFLEPRVSGERADRICDRLGFTNNVCVESKGFAGGV